MFHKKHSNSNLVGSVISGQVSCKKNTMRRINIKTAVITSPTNVNILSILPVCEALYRILGTMAIPIKTPKSHPPTFEVGLLILKPQMHESPKREYSIMNIAYMIAMNASMHLIGPSYSIACQLTIIIAKIPPSMPNIAGILPT